MEHLGLRYRSYANAEQERMLTEIFGCVRLTWNIALEQRFAARGAYHRQGSPKRFKFPSYSSQCTELKELRDDPDYLWLKQVPMQILQQTLRDLDQAWSGWLRGKKGKPRFKRKQDSCSFRDPQHVYCTRASEKWAFIKIQGLGQIKTRLHRPVSGIIKHATMTLEPDGKLYISLCVKRRTHEAKPRELPPAGADLGVIVPLALSSGETFGEDFRSLTVKEEERLLRLERQRERQKKGSNNRQKTQLAINTLKSRQRHRRQDLIEQVSSYLAKNHSLVAFEDLSVKNMTASAKGTVDNPGKNVKQKAGLNRVILDKSWGAVRTRSEQKLSRAGGAAPRVPAAYTSRKCPECHWIDGESRVSRGLFVCTSCGHAGHADVNAAKNILERALGEGAQATVDALILAGGTPVAASREGARERQGRASPTAETSGSRHVLEAGIKTEDQGRVKRASVEVETVLEASAFGRR
jgi:putative transposase